MELVIGGAFQGKLAYATKKYGLKAADICECSVNKEPDFSKKCIYRFERYVLWCMRNGRDPVTSFEDDKVIIMDDIFCGVVPAEPETRAWREASGRTMAAIAQNADTVTRLFCGIPKRIKG